MLRMYVRMAGEFVAYQILFILRLTEARHGDDHHLHCQRN